MNIGKYVWGCALVVSSVAAAYLLGVFVADLYSSQQNNVFETLDGEKVTLSNVVTGPSLITFFAPDCYLCTEHLDNARVAVSDTSDYRRVVLISSSDRVDLQKAIGSYEIRFPILWDRDRLYSHRLNVVVEPLVIEIDEDMVIRQIVAGALTTNEIREVFEGQ